MVYGLSTDIGDTLRGGQDVAYVFAVTEEGVVAKRAAVGEEAADIQGCWSPKKALSSARL